MLQAHESVMVAFDFGNRDVEVRRPLLREAGVKAEYYVIGVRVIEM